VTQFPIMMSSNCLAQITQKAKGRIGSWVTTADAHVHTADATQLNCVNSKLVQFLIFNRNPPAIQFTQPTPTYNDQGLHRLKAKWSICMALHGNPSQSHGVSPAIWDHTVQQVTQVNMPHLNTSQANWYSIYLPWGDGRWSWPWWLAIYRGGLPVRRQSPVQAVTTSQRPEWETNPQPLDHKLNAPVMSASAVWTGH